ncbi:CBS domain-containing protein [Paenibacillus sp. PR3]|uniref:CBS domain-containing protein n=1 Tax=Paenibacillus terricola TaxID=2763503 RepID=A0ABR8MZY7_9BACL|nr:methyl-accepting chemotaxis protein [Paenibacillus terricola]MBD3919759.1 CBS domain-containing protein [Paenibacillus terricola]
MQLLMIREEAEQKQEQVQEQKQELKHVQEQKQAPIEPPADVVVIPTIRLSDYLRYPVTVSADTSCLDLLRLFKSRVDEECAVVTGQAGEPLGLIMRNRFYHYLSQRFGSELYYNKPVTKLMDAEPLMIDSEMDPASLIGQALSRDEATLYNCVIVTEGAKLAGMLTVGDLLRISRDIQDAAVQQKSVVLKETQGLMASIEREIAEVKQSTMDGSNLSTDMVMMTQQGKMELDQVREGLGRLTELAAAQKSHFDELQERARDVGQVTSLIRELAETCNLLSLNAAIEAARAGEHGRSFAVVADEVMKLAVETKQSADTIASLVRGIQGAIEETSRLHHQSQADTRASNQFVESAASAFDRLCQSAEHNRDSSRLVAELTNQAHNHSVSVQERLEDL